MINRTEFLQTLGIGFLGMGASTFVNKTSMQDGEKFNPVIVEEFVGASHRDIDKVKELLAEHPNLINAAHDWKNGDFETGLGAASHVGYKELASFLIENGAQVNIFTAALFGKMEIIKPILDFFPQALNAKGPHGFTLLHHANKGGDEALEVKEYLMDLGATETKIAMY
jgi:hypothetical protein